MNPYDQRASYQGNFPPSPYKPIVSTLGTIATIQAIAIVIAVLALALRDGTCYL